MRDNFDDPVSMRLYPDIRKRVVRVVRRDRGERFDNESHFYRVAVMKLLRETEAEARR